MWPNSYEEALLEWSKIRESCSNLPLEDALHTVHDWCQQVPLVNHYLHFADYEEWPLPWDLLANNTFCDIAKSLLLLYTLLLIRHPEISSLALAQTDNYCLLLVNNGDYVLNDTPGEITTDLTDVAIKRTIPGEYFDSKIK